jgi:hypothetical protein
MIVDFVYLLFLGTALFAWLAILLIPILLVFLLIKKLRANK